ncbi:hypothetical protein GCM10010885_04140 [Alicyclobacillus cellulosilyticus]|uniref:Peptidase M23-like protein n=1 Tax=Alicyclobacillus cellulosilyticus TaxID=1003997 RepID=A0A917K4I1_9BACL|nr:hypothetical protein [Alicyclobacillus cellulosilyticus]GGI97632.1 hypothetical protein GCM10010885_04140 [Alicyclobacillus cellulosilyticus]
MNVPPFSLWCPILAVTAALVVVQPPAPSPGQTPMPVHPHTAQGGANAGTARGTTPNVATPGQAAADRPLPDRFGTGRPFSPYVPWPTSRLRVRVIDGRTLEPLPGAEVVLIETEQRLTTGPDGFTPWFDAPVIRNPRYRPMVAELHGQLGVIAYKNGYRDSIHLGIRMHEGIPTETTVWMYKIGPQDRRIEPVLYQEPYHHIWLVELADKFRSRTQPGEGPERP